MPQFTHAERPMYGLEIIAIGPFTTVRPSFDAAVLNNAPDAFSGIGGSGYSFVIGATNGEFTRCPEIPISHPPCSSTTTLRPAVDNCLAMIPPAAPDPIMTKSTSVAGVNCGIACSPVPLSARLRQRVVISERRLVVQRVVVLNQLPPGLVVI